ncbi:MAG: DNA repair protein RecO [Phycisphaerales bacterium]|nr:DNA repair protein RecO [Phycisphaerales bacterium]
MPTIKDEAVCIRHWDWSETSQTVSLFARQTGVLRAVAKGAKRENARFSGGLEILTRGLAIAIVKPTDGLATLTAWDLLETFPAVRRSLPAFYAGMYLADLVHHAVRDSDPHPRLFDAMVEALRELGGPAGPAWGVLRFQWSALVETGFKPELARDVRTGADLPESGSYTFLPGLGGLAAGEARSTDGWKVRSGTVTLLRSLESGALSPEAAGPESGKTVLRAGRLLAAYWREVLGLEPPSMRAYIEALERPGSPDPGIK